MTPTTVAIKVGRPAAASSTVKPGSSWGRCRAPSHDRGDRHRGDVAGGLEARAAHELERQQASGGGCGQSRESWPFSRRSPTGPASIATMMSAAKAIAPAATPAASARLRKAAVNSSFPARRASAAGSDGSEIGACGNGEDADRNRGGVDPAGYKISAGVPDRDAAGDNRFRGCPERERSHDRRDREDSRRSLAARFRGPCRRGWRRRCREG